VSKWVMRTLFGLLRKMQIILLVTPVKVN
jgi:hypothetical protein